MQASLVAMILESTRQPHTVSNGMVSSHKRSRTECLISHGEVLTIHNASHNVRGLMGWIEVECDLDLFV